MIFSEYCLAYNLTACVFAFTNTITITKAWVTDSCYRDELETSDEIVLLAAEHFEPRFIAVKSRAFAHFKSPL